jgi:transposase
MKLKNIDLLTLAKTVSIPEIAELFGVSVEFVEKRIKKLSTPKPSRIACEYNKSNMTLPYREFLHK